MIKKIFKVIKYIIIKRGFFGISSPFRTLPSFIIIGVKRCGTTTLFENLAEHPCIEKSSHDNIGFFNDNFHLGINWYKSHFVTLNKKNEIIKKFGKFATYDVTTSYIRNPELATKIKAEIPNCKIIAILRNPIDRAFSEYNENLKKKPNMDSFEKIILQELNDYRKISDEDINLIIKQLNLIGKGLYQRQLKKWFEMFSKESILILSTEEFEKNPDMTYSKIFHFLELPDHKIKNTKKFNKNLYSKMDGNIRKKLEEFFEPHNNELFNLINENFKWNK